MCCIMYCKEDIELFECLSQHLNIPIFLIPVESTTRKSGVGDMCCIMYCKEDIELFEWVSQLLNVPVQDYGRYIPY